MVRSFRLNPQPLPPAPTPAAAREAAARACTVWLEHRELADGPAADFPSVLADALDPLRTHPALGVRCLKCGRGLGFVALAPTGVRVVSGTQRSPKRQRRGGIYDLAAATEPTGRFEGWIDDAAKRRSSVIPTGEAPGQHSGFPQRRTYQCPRCGSHSTVKNSTLLGLYLTAVRRGDADFRLLLR